MGNIDSQDITNLVTAITALVVAVEVVWSKITHKNVKELKNGELKAKVKEALDEYSNEADRL